MFIIMRHYNNMKKTELYLYSGSESGCVMGNSFEKDPHELLYDKTHNIIIFKNSKYRLVKITQESYHILIKSFGIAGTDWDDYINVTSLRYNGIDGTIVINIHNKKIFNLLHNDDEYRYNNMSNYNMLSNISKHTDNDK